MAVTAAVASLYILIVGFLGTVLRLGNNVILSLVATGAVLVVVEVLLVVVVFELEDDVTELLLLDELFELNLADHINDLLPRPVLADLDE